MSNTFYGGVPVENVDFEKECREELKKLKEKIKELEKRLNSDKKMNHHFWTIKLNRANKALEVGEVTLS